MKVDVHVTIGQWLRSYVPPTPVGRSLVAVTITDSVGTGLYLSGSVIYFVKGIGLSSRDVGLGLSFLASVPLGMMGDRIGSKRLLVVLQLFRGAMLVLLTFATSFVDFLCVAIALTIAARSVSPATQAVVAATMSKDDRVATMAIMRSVRNVGYSVGAALTIPIFALGSLWAYRSLMLGNAVTFVLSALLLMRVSTPAHIRPVSGRRRYLVGVRDWRFLGLTLVNGCLSLHSSILSVALPLWVLATGGPRWLVSLLLILNTMLAFLLQVASTRGSDSPDFGQRALRRAALALVICCFILAAAPLGGRYVAIVALILGAIALTAGEIMQSAGGWDLSFRYSPADTRAEHLATFNLGPAAQDIVGPLLLTTVISFRSAGWLALSALFVVAGILVRPAVTAVTRHQSRAPPGPGAPPPAPPAASDR